MTIRERRAAAAALLFCWPTDIPKSRCQQQYFKLISNTHESVCCGFASVEICRNIWLSLNKQKFSHAGTYLLREYLYSMEVNFKIWILIIIIKINFRGKIKSLHKLLILSALQIYIPDHVKIINNDKLIDNKNLLQNCCFMTCKFDLLCLLDELWLCSW